MNKRIRAFFDSKGYLEVSTPILSKYAIKERTIEKFETVFSHPFDGDEKLYLLPSPEYYIKRFLAENPVSVYEISKCFRNGEQTGPLHSPEFTMLEYYTVFSDYIASISLTEELFKYIGFEKETLIYTMNELFIEKVGFSLYEAQSLERIKDAALSLSLIVEKDDIWDDIFYKIFLTFIEPGIEKDKIVFIKDYPKQIECLSKERGIFKERWEVYINGIEIGNCYSELENHSSYMSDGSGFSKLLLPPSSGVAIGLDRLLAVKEGLDDIRKVMLFSFS